MAKYKKDLMDVMQQVRLSATLDDGKPKRKPYTDETITELDKKVC